MRAFWLCNSQCGSFEHAAMHKLSYLHNKRSHFCRLSETHVKEPFPVFQNSVSEQLSSRHNRAHSACRKSRCDLSQQLSNRHDIMPPLCTQISPMLSEPLSNRHNSNRVICRSFEQNQRNLLNLLILLFLILSPLSAFSQLKNMPADSDSLDFSYELKLLQLQSEMAEQEAKKTDLFHSLIPHVSISIRIGQRSLLFVDPSSPITFPTDALGAVLSFDIDKITNRIPHKEALIKVEEAKLEIEKKRSELIYEISLVKSQISLIDSILFQLEKKRIYKQKLVDQYQLRFDEAKGEYEQLIRAKLDLSETELEISKLQSQQTELKLKLRFKLCSHSLN